MAIQAHQQVTIEYELKSEGKVVDSNVGKPPLIFTFGSGQIIPGLESRIAHMDEGQSETVTIPAAEAYGEYNEAATQVIPKEQFDSQELAVGMPLQGRTPDGRVIRSVIKEIRENEVVIDYNHPMAGKELEFTVKVVRII